MHFFSSLDFCRSFAASVSVLADMVVDERRARRRLVACARASRGVTRAGLRASRQRQWSPQLDFAWQVFERGQGASHLKALRAVALAEAFATQDLKFFLRSTAGRGVVSRRADALLERDQPWELANNAGQYEPEEHALRLRAWPYFSAHVVADDKRVDRLEAQHVRLLDRHQFASIGWVAPAATLKAALCGLGEGNADDARPFSFDDFWGSLKAAQVGHPPRPATTWTKLANLLPRPAPRAASLALENVQADVRQAARDRTRAALRAHDERVDLAPPEFRNAYTQ